MKYLLKTTFIVLFFASVLSAQYGSVGTVDAKSMGMGKTYLTTSTGVMSVGLNPANLIYKNEGDIELATVLPLPAISLRTGTDFMSIEDVNYFFGGVDGKSRVLSESDKQRLNDLFKDGGFFFTNVGVKTFGFSYTSEPSIGSFAFSMDDFIGSKFTLPQALVDIAMTGNPVGKTYDFNDASGNAWWIRTYSLSYAREIPELKQDIFDKIGAGITLKMVHGFAYAGIEKANTFIKTGDQNVLTGNADLLMYTSFSPDLGVKYDFDSVDAESNVGPFPATAGTGFGFDLGFTAQMDEWTFALALTDIGSITWDKHAAQFVAKGDLFINDFSDEAQFDTLKERLTGEAYPISSFSTSLASALRLGASYYFNSDEDDVPGSLLLALDYNQGFNDMPGNSKNPRFSIGADWKPMDYIPYIRTGFSFGGADGFNWAFGLGFDAGLVEFHLATSDMNSMMAPNSAKRISVAFGSRWKF